MNESTMNEGHLHERRYACSTLIHSAHAMRKTNFFVPIVAVILYLSEKIYSTGTHKSIFISLFFFFFLDHPKQFLFLKPFNFF